jgi:alanyl-tRNA synthetase
VKSLFAEGGGQPSDLGWVNEVPVLDVQREEGRIVHVVQESVPVGEEVEVKVDWSRRFDHMQQHSGQHLISAVAWNTRQSKTVSWKLSAFPFPCYVDLVGEFTADRLKELEFDVNQRILSGKKMKVHVFQRAEDLSCAGKSVKEGFLEKHDFSSSALRVIEIDGEDFNACCGTHVCDTSQLQMIKFVGTEKIKGNCRLYFCVGGRCSMYFSQMFDITTKLGSMMNTGAENLVSAVERLKNEQKQTRKELQTLLSEIVQTEGEKLVAMQEKDPQNFIVYQRPGLDLTLLRNMTKVLESKFPQTLAICFSDDQFLVSSGTNDELVTLVGKKICSMLNGKGGGGGGKGRPYQGKFPKENLSESFLLECDAFLNSQF